MAIEIRNKFSINKCSKEKSGKINIRRAATDSLHRIISLLNFLNHLI